MTRAHETYYREELRNVDNSHIIIPQPLNRGSGVAVAPALHILQRGADAVVVFVPCDHYYSTMRHSAVRSDRQVHS